MILLDALHINNSGGKILLDYLIESLEKTDLKVYYLLDDRIKNNHASIRVNKVKYLKANMTKRFLFYNKESNKFTKIFCFGNLPPPVKLKGQVYTYFHQKLFLKSSKTLSVFFRLKLFLKSKIISFLVENTDFWILQTEVMKRDFLLKFINEKKSKVLVIPFYPKLMGKIKNNQIDRKVNTFLYVSVYSPHKNYENLLEGFAKFYDKNQIGELHLTLKNEPIEIITKITNLQNAGYPIVNHGFVSRGYLAKLYSDCQYIIYPSLVESFGLGIIEGIENGCNVIGADLEYLTAICEPSFVFNPHSVADIATSIEKATKQENFNSTKQKVFDEINKIIEILN